MLQRKTGLKRTAGPTRKKGLCAQSRALRRVKAEQRRAYAAAGDAEQPFCSACGCVEPLEHSHILSQKMWPQHRANPLNWLLLCHGCHCTYEHRKADFARLYPTAYAETLRRMELVDPQAFNFYLLKNPAA